MSLGIKAANNGGSMPGAGSIRQIPQGAYQQGDPGIFGDIWGGIKGAVGGAAKGLLSGNPFGIVTGALGGAISGATGQKGSVMTATPPLPPMLNPRSPFQGAPTGIRVGGMAPGGAAPYIGMDYGPGPMMAGKASSTGHHWNKSGYFLKDGTWIAPGTKQVKNRRRNPLNPRALDRSISRITSAKRASSKLSRVTIRKKSCK